MGHRDPNSGLGKAVCPSQCGIIQSVEDWNTVKRLRKKAYLVIVLRIRVTVEMFTSLFEGSGDIIEENAQRM